MDVFSFHDMDSHKISNFVAGVAEGVWQVNLGISLADIGIWPLLAAALPEAFPWDRAG
jgi:hypothetical protein